MKALATCTIMLAATAVFVACGADKGEGGTGGTGGAPPPPANVDQTCRDWCANEPEGFSCHQGPAESVEGCYQDCLDGYQFAKRVYGCGDEWIAIRNCQVELDCEDLFGDCDTFDDQLRECRQPADTPAPCEQLCPNMACQRDFNSPTPKACEVTLECSEVNCESVCSDVASDSRGAAFCDNSVCFCPCTACVPID